MGQLKWKKKQMYEIFNFRKLIITFIIFAAPLLLLPHQKTRNFII